MTVMHSGCFFSYSLAICNELSLLPSFTTIASMLSLTSAAMIESRHRGSNSAILYVGMMRDKILFIIRLFSFLLQESSLIIIPGRWITTMLPTPLVLAIQKSIHQNMEILNAFLYKESKCALNTRRN